MIMYLLNVSIIAFVVTILNTVLRIIRNIIAYLSNSKLVNWQTQIR